MNDNIITVNEGAIQEKLDEKIKMSVEEVLNKLLDAEADRLCGAKRYERSEARKDTRAGYYERGMQTRVGEVRLKVPKLRKLPFETAIIERYRRREISVEEAMMEMYLAGVSVRRVEDITQALWGAKVSPATVSNINQKLYKRINEWRNEPLEEEYPYIYFDGIALKRSWGGEVSNVSVLVAIGVDKEGYRKIIGIVEGAKEDKTGWSGFMKHLKQRGLKSIKLAISDKCLGLIESLEEYYPMSKWQRCVVHFYRNIFSYVPTGKMKQVSTMLKAIHAQECPEAALNKARAVATALSDMKLAKAAEILESGIKETLTYMEFPLEHWVRIRSNNPLERILREIRRRTRVVGCFPDGESALMLAAARLRHIAGTKWGSAKYLNVELFNKKELEVLENIKVLETVND
jgi:transposase-like protein